MGVPEGGRSYPPRLALPSHNSHAISWNSSSIYRRFISPNGRERFPRGESCYGYRVRGRRRTTNSSGGSIQLEQLVKIGKIPVWPVPLVVVLFLFREPLRKLIDSSKEVDVRGPGGVQATFRAAEAAAFLGAAEGQRLSEAAGDQTSPDSHDVRGVANSLSESATEEDIGRLS